MRLFLLTLAGILLVAAAGLGAFYYLSPHARLRIAEGSEGFPAHKMVAAFIAISSAQHPRLRIESVQTPDLAAAAAAIQTHAADLAIIRSDVAIPDNAATIAILRRDVVAVVTPAKSPIAELSDLAGKTIGVVEGPLQRYNSAALDTLLSFYDVPADSVRRLVMPLSEIGRAMAGRRIAAALAVGPIGPGEIVEVVAAIKAATRAAPGVVAVDEAETINRRFPAFESIDIPAGAFRGRPPTPDDAISGVAVTYRFVAPNSMFDIVAAAIAQSLFAAKARLAHVSPLAAQIEAPDTDDKNQIPPIHPGVISYLDNGEQSFFDTYSDYFYMAGMALSAIGSIVALIVSWLSSRRSEAEVEKTNQLIALADNALRARDLDELDATEAEFASVVAWFVKLNRSDSGGASMAIGHVRYVITRRRKALLAARETRGADADAAAPGLVATSASAPRANGA